MRRQRLAPAGPFSPIRGFQWRLAMAWGGVELMGNTLFPRKYRSIGKTQWNPLEVWVNTLAWNKLKKPVKGLERPGNRIARDFLGESVDQLDFLGLQDGAKRTALQSWMMEGKTLDTPKDALRLAECFRDLAAHGLLSASRAEKLGIVGMRKNQIGTRITTKPRNVFSELTAIVGEFAFRTNCLFLNYL